MKIDSIAPIWILNQLLRRIIESADATSKSTDAVSNPKHGRGGGSPANHGVCFYENVFVPRVGDGGSMLFQICQVQVHITILVHIDADAGCFPSIGQCVAISIYHGEFWAVA